ncbi:hypothetical protein V6246_07160 [Algibacter sp. TI.3.09]|uniref:hypothetical protein n=1 Tax=Algibacter sp. TI.3.09 TaxID=3121298 RepID=UPI00311ED038
MKKLSDFKGSKVDLKEIQGGKTDYPIISGYFIPDYPPDYPGGPGKMNWVRPDVNWISV